MPARLRLPELNRQFVFGLIAVVVCIPILWKFSFREYPSPMVRKVFDKVQSLPAGSKVLLALDYDPGSEAELQPMARAFLRHCAERKMKIYFMTLWATGPPVITRAIEDVLVPEFPDYRYGRDFVTLGYKPGNEAAVAIVASDLKKLFTTDGRGANINDIEMTRTIRNIRSFDIVLSVSAGFPGTKEWIQYGTDPAGIPIAAGMTAVQAPLNYPYYPRQLLGLLGGIKAAAEYEALLKETYQKYNDPKYHLEATARMGPQTWAHLAIIGLIILGNLTTLLARAGRGRN